MAESSSMNLKGGILLMVTLHGAQVSSRSCITGVSAALIITITLVCNVSEEKDLLKLTEQFL